jgi:hypothetical protein
MPPNQAKMIIASSSMRTPSLRRGSAPPAFVRGRQIWIAVSLALLDVDLRHSYTLAVSSCAVIVECSGGQAYH